MILLERAGQVALEQTRAAWSGFVAGRDVESAGVRPHVLRAWRRSSLSRCDPHLMKADVLSAGQTSDLLASEAVMIGGARPFMAALSRAAGGERHAAMLADRHGRVIDVIGDEETVRGPEAVPGPGALLSEATAGANGIGTPLSEGRYVEIVGPEHYIEGFHPFTCQGIPLTGMSGEVIGVLSASVRQLATAARVRNVLFCASQSIECELIGRWLTRVVVERGDLPSVVEKLRQDMIQALATARLRLESAAARLARGGDAAAQLAKVEGLAQQFRRQADAWRDIVTDAPDQLTALPLEERLEAVRELFETEARIHAIELIWGASERARVLEDRRSLTRRLLGALIRAAQLAGAGGRIRMDVVVRRALKLGVVVLTPEGGMAPARVEEAAQLVD